MHDKMKKYLQICESCQKRAIRRQKKALHPTGISVMWKKIDFDVIHMLKSEEKSYFVIVKNDLFEGSKVKTLSKINAKAVAKFFGEDVICKHEIFDKLIMNEKFENKETVDEFAKRYEIKKIIIFDYHSQTNEMIERGHKSIINSLLKMINGDITNWVQNLPAMLGIDRITIRQSIGHIPFYLNCDNKAIMSIELDHFIGRIFPGKEVCDTSNLIVMRARQIQRWDEDLEKTVLFFQRMKKQGKENFDTIKQIRENLIVFEMMILLHDIKLDNMHIEKFQYKGIEFFRIHKITEKGIYIFKKFDDIQLIETYLGNKVKEFHFRDSLFSENSDQRTITSEEKTNLSDLFQNFIFQQLQDAISQDQSFAMIIFNNRNEIIEAE